jgi:hypothetical protein
MRMRGLFLLAPIILLSAFLMIAVMLAATHHPDTTQAADDSQLSANELAESLGVHWWRFNVPTDIHPDDRVSVRWFTTSGSSPGAGIGFIQTQQKPIGQIKIFCWSAGNRTMVKMTSTGVEGSSYSDDILTDHNISCMNNGSVIKEGDFMLITSKEPHPKANYPTFPGRMPEPDEMGLKIEIERKPVAASQAH